ncbi:hypothetical protein MY4824_003439 [Beauveria thailandica]
MNSVIVQAWLHDLAMANHHPNTPSEDVDEDSIENFDLDQTPVQRNTGVGVDAVALNTSTRSASSFPAVLASRPVFSHQHSTDNSQPDDTSQRSSSPSKRFQKMASLRGLGVPVYFSTQPAPGVMPADTMELREALSAVEAKEALLPAVLRSHPDFQGNTRIRRQTWLSDDDTCSAADRDAVLQNHGRLRDIVDESRESAEVQRSEAAWNSHVHSNLLKHVTRHTQHLKFEDISSARIIPAFRPRLSSGKQASAAASNTSGCGPTAALITSVHKMVDFALVMRPSDVLQTLIDRFLEEEPWENQSINQTLYEPLRTRPAPIFIKTKTVSGTKENANVQLGIWVAAWRERMRPIMALAGAEEEKLLTLPVIQVMDSAWSVSFVVDEGTHICIIDDNYIIGNTNSMLGIYQLQASMAALGAWVKDVFEPWFTKLLTRAVENRGNPTAVEAVALDILST